MNWHLYMAILGVIISSSPVKAQRTIRLQNAMKAPIRVHIQADDQLAPSELRIRVGDVVPFPINFEGTYSIQVVPDDQPKSGYRRKDDLREVARVLNGQPLPLRGVFEHVITPEGELKRIRTEVYFWVPGEVRPRVIHRMDYVGDYQGEAQPSRTTAVISFNVPENAEVFINGDRTEMKGSYRCFETPHVQPGKDWKYTFRIEWVAYGVRNNIDRDVWFRAGEAIRLPLRFPAGPPEKIKVVAPIKVPAPIKIPAPRD